MTICSKDTCLWTEIIMRDLPRAWWKPCLICHIVFGQSHGMVRDGTPSLHFEKPAKRHDIIHFDPAAVEERHLCRQT